MLAELGRVLAYSRIKRILEEAEVDPRIALASVVRRVVLQRVREGAVDKITADPSDNRILECAIQSKAEYILSSDRHLLELADLNGIRIVTVKDFLDHTNKSQSS